MDKPDNTGKIKYPFAFPAYCCQDRRNDGIVVYADGAGNRFGRHGGNGVSI